MENIQMIPIDKLHPHPKNPRLHIGDVTELADSIRQNGVMQNLTVVPMVTSLDGSYIVVIGHRRLAAAKIAGLTELPCAVVDMDAKAQIATMLLENMQRRELTVYEEAAGMQMMIDLGDSYEDIAESTGLSQSTVRRRVKLLRELGDDGLRAATGKQIDINDMERIAELHDPVRQQKALEAAGTRDFEWTMTRLLNEQEMAQQLADLEAYVSGFAKKVHTILPQYKRITLLHFRGIGAFSPCSEREYVYKVCPLNAAVEIYTVLSESEMERKAELEREKGTYGSMAKKTATEFNAAAKRKEDDENKRISKLRELIDTARKCRDRFIEDIPGNAAYPEKAMEFAVRMLLLITGTLIERDLLERFACFDTDELCRTIRGSRTYAARILINAAYLAATERGDLDDYSNSSGRYAENNEIDELYEALEVLGYEMSTEERQLANGAHELYN